MTIMRPCPARDSSPLRMEAASGRFEVTIRLNVDDPGLLWRAAAAQALSYSGCEATDLEEMLGPIEDPNLADCVAMLLGPRALSGCLYEAFAVRAVEPAAVREPASRRSGAGDTVRRLHRERRTAATRPGLFPG